MSGWELPDCGHLECEESCEGPEPGTLEYAQMVAEKYGDLEDAAIEDGMDPQPVELHTCGYPEDSFACKIRHQYLQHGWAKGDH